MTANRAAGRFVTFEGIEGSGKTTQVTRLAERLRRLGQRVATTREPGGTDVGRQLRAVLLRPAEHPMASRTELLLYAADRAQHLHEVVLPALERGEVVICDRYLDATLAYQGHGRGIAAEEILELHRRAPLDLRPRRTVLIDLETSIGLSRARDRDHGETARLEGRFEAEEVAFHERVRRGYLELARLEPARFRIVDGAAEANGVEREVWSALADVFPDSTP
jgi:dTMP kinase